MALSRATDFRAGGLSTATCVLLPGTRLPDV